MKKKNSILMMFAGTLLLVSLACSIGRPEVVIPAAGAGSSTTATYTGPAVVSVYYGNGEIECTNDGTATLVIDRVDTVFKMFVVSPSTRTDCSLDGTKLQIDFSGDIGFGYGTDLSLVFRVCIPAVPGVAVGNQDYNPNGPTISGTVECFYTNGDRYATVEYDLKIND